MTQKWYNPQETGQGAAPSAYSYNPGYQQYSTGILENPYLEWLEESPELAYYSNPMMTGIQRPGERRYLQGQFQNVWSDYLGGLGEQIRAGQDPTAKFQDYLASDPFTQRYAALTPQQAGRTTGRFSPTTRQIYY